MPSAKSCLTCFVCGVSLVASAAVHAQIGTDYGLPPLQQSSQPEMPSIVSESSAPVGNADFIWEDPASVSFSTKAFYGHGLSGQAETALRHGQYEEAYRLFQQLKKEGDRDLAAYGLALAFSQQGKFEGALQAVKPLAQREGVYQGPASQLERQLLLTLAEEAQLKEQSSKADKWLRAYHRVTEGEDPHPRYIRLARAQGWEVRGPEVSEEDAYLRIGLLLPLSGKLEKVGQDALKAAQMSLFDANQEDVVLYPEDTRGTTEGTREAVQRLIHLGVDAIVGPVLADHVEAAAPTVRQNNVPLLSLSSDERVAGPFTWLLGYLPADQVQAITRHAVAQGKKTFSVLVPQNGYGRTVSGAFQQELDVLGIPLVRPTTFSPKSVDIGSSLDALLLLKESRARLAKERKALEEEYQLLGQAMDDDALKRLKKLRKMEPEATIDFEALLIPAPAQAMHLIASQLAFYDVTGRDVQLLGTALWKNDAIFQGDASYMRGGRFVAPPEEGIGRFNRRFSEAYGHSASGPALLAYDGVTLLAGLMSTSQGDIQALLGGLTRPEGFSGLSGAFRLTKDGLNERAYDVFEIQRKGFKNVQKSAVLLPPPLPKKIVQQPGAAIQPRDEGGWLW